MHATYEGQFTPWMPSKRLINVVTEARVLGMGRGTPLICLLNMATDSRDEVWKAIVRARKNSL